MHKLGHYGGDARLMEIISHHLEVCECFNHEEDDGGYITDFKRRAGDWAISHHGGHPLGLSLRRRRPAEQAINEVVSRKAQIEAVRDYIRNERNIPVVLLSSDESQFCPCIYCGVPLF
ncbi:PREDICTED: uncharacterized protein LOC105146278 [Acromyrmex echinatior]|uniref:uncharacterized protein LOC105146278 n=1 Tax=Acromyrmex echinatior TaxID=103372 RepID=UPI000580FBFD|nr:PREDICTED: uncharacterized protein LOC105146278 [Acromyrmex echinatior]